MKNLFRLTIILGISLLGEILGMLIPLPIPASIYGLILMLLALMTHIVPLERVETTGRFLIEIMPVMFIPAAVGLIDSWQDLRPMLLPALIAIFAVTFVVMGVTGLVTQALMRHAPAQTESDQERKVAQ